MPAAAPDGAVVGSAAASQSTESSALPSLLLEIVGKVLAPSAALAGLGFYFGWVRTSALFAFFGVSRDLVGFTTQDYLTRSLEGLFVPLGAVGAVVALALVVHASVAELLRRRRGLRALSVAALVSVIVGIGLAVLGLGALITSRRLFGLSPLVLAVALIVGVSLCAAGLQVRSALARADRRSDPPAIGAVQVARGVTIGLLLALGLFWATAQYASDVGRARAQVVLAGIQQSSDSVTVYTAAPLHLAIDGVREDVLPGPDGTPTYRYRGFKPLAVNATRYVLTSAGWTPESGQIAVLEPADVLYLEYVRDGR